MNLLAPRHSSLRRSSLRLAHLLLVCALLVPSGSTIAAPGGFAGFTMPADAAGQQALFKRALDANLGNDFFSTGSAAKNVGVIKEMLVAGFGSLSSTERTSLLGQLGALGTGKGESAVRIILGGLGPGYVKFGQILSSRGDLVGDRYRTELQKLTDAAPPATIEQVQQAVQKAAGKPLAKIFKSFDTKPLGVGSVAQVHRAQLHNGQWVAVKVIKPGVKTALASNLTQMKNVVAQAQGLGEFMAPVLDQLSKISAFETNLSYEGKAIRKASRLMRGLGGLEQAPHVYRNISNADLLVEALAPGKKANVAAQSMSDAERKVVGDRLMMSIFRQIFFDGFFHADPTEANVFAAPGKKGTTLTFIDWGLHARIGLEQRVQLIKLVGAIVANKPEMVLSTLQQIDTNKTAPAKLQPIVGRLMGWGAPAGAKLQQILIDTQKVGLKVPHAVTLVSKAIFQAEGLAQQIHPDAKTPQLAELKQAALRYPLQRVKGALLNLKDRVTFRNYRASRVKAR